MLNYDPNSPFITQRAPLREKVIFRKLKQENAAQKDPPACRVFRRLVACNKYLHDPLVDYFYPNRLKKRASKDAIEFMPQIRISIPGCCAPHGRDVKKEVQMNQRFLYHSPPTSGKIGRQKQPVERLTQQKFVQNAQSQYPLPTVCVRWHCTGYYTPMMLYRALEPYGRTENIVITSTNSANIVFSTLSSACKVVSDHLIGSPQTRLFCFWYHKSLSERYFYGCGKTFRVWNNDMVYK